MNRVQNNIKLVHEFFCVDGSHLFQTRDVSQAPHRQDSQHLLLSHGTRIKSCMA